MKENVSVSKEDYIAAIYRLQAKRGWPAKTSELSEAMGVTMPSVSEMCRRLESDRLVAFKTYRGVALTQKGILKARKVIRKHRILECFFSHALRIDSKRVHDEAHKIEHFISDDVSERISWIIGNPDSCPHGQSIPAIDASS